MKTHFFLIIVFVCVMLFSCTQTEEQKKYNALRKTVLLHYQSDPNPLKPKAARFLLDNLKGQYAIEGERYKAYSDTIKMYAANRDTLHKKLFLLKKLPLASEVVPDVDRLTPQFLIDNIDQAFNAWEKAAWRDDVSFENFCEYVLPYRIGNEPLEDWRQVVLHDTIFKTIGDTLFTITDIKKAAILLSKEEYRLKKSFSIKMGETSSNIPDVPYSILNSLRTGTCSNLIQRVMFPYRALAIPIANDFVPNWANARTGHDWAAIISKTKSYPFNPPANDTLGFYKTKDRILVKVYRHTFSENKESHAKQREQCDFLPSFFNDPRIKDVTGLYGKTNDLTVPVLLNPNREEFAYLAVFNASGWFPLAWGRIHGDVAEYKKIAGPAVFLPVFVSKEGILHFNAPFIFSDNGSIRFLTPDHKNLRKVELTRKFPLDSRIQDYTKRMINGRFQVANTPDFKDAVTIYTIPEDPGVYYNEAFPNSKGRFRYARYISTESGKCAVAEIEFYTPDAKTPLTGKVIGAEKYPSNRNAFDGDVLTFIDILRNGDNWVGLDFEKPVSISKIRFSARNDKNHIIPGNSYELFYWENEWKSLGPQIASGRSLFFDRVPSNCLLLLRNYTEGKEERIFTYEDGKQVWW